MLSTPLPSRPSGRSEYGDAVEWLEATSSKMRSRKMTGRHSAKPRWGPARNRPRHSAGRARATPRNVPLRSTLLGQHGPVRLGALATLFVLLLAAVAQAALTASKSPNPNSLPEPGGTVTFTVSVANTEGASRIITAFSDNLYPLNGTCASAVGTVIANNTTFTCSFTATVSGDPAQFTDTVTVSVRSVGVLGQPTGQTTTRMASATVRITDVKPVISVSKSANPTSLPEPGGTVQYTVSVTNNSVTSDPVTLDSLSDDVYGDLTTRPGSTCNTAIGTVVQPGSSYTCTFSASFTGSPGDSLTDKVTATGKDDENNTATDDATATVSITNALPVISVTKSADPTSRPEPGGSFQYTVGVTNNSVTSDPVTLGSVTDDVYGNLTTRSGSTCNTAIGTVVQPGSSYTCTFSASFTGSPGDSLTDTVTVTGKDDENSTASDDASATVQITGEPPAISVTKSANPTSRPAPGGTFEFSVGVTNNSATSDPVTITSLLDSVYGELIGKGTCTGATIQPGSTYSCTFPGEFSGSEGDSQTSTVTATVEDDEKDSTAGSASATVSITAAPEEPVGEEPNSGPSGNDGNSGSHGDDCRTSGGRTDCSSKIQLKTGDTGDGGKGGDSGDAGKGGPGGDSGDAKGGSGNGGDGGPGGSGGSGGDGNGGSAQTSNGGLGGDGGESGAAGKGGVSGDSGSIP